MSYDRKAYNKARYLANKERLKAAAIAHAKANPEQTRCAKLRRNYGITLAEYDEMLEAQGGRCKIEACRTDVPGGHGRFHVDHNHETGKIRGLLCHRCNIGLGHFRDSPHLLQSARDYLLTEGYYGSC